jgi:hypothetical protein
MACFNINELTKVKILCPDSGKSMNAIMIRTLDDNDNISRDWFVEDNGTYTKSIKCLICGKEHEAATIRSIRRK